MGTATRPWRTVQVLWHKFANAVVNFLYTNAHFSHPSPPEISRLGHRGTAATWPRANARIGIEFDVHLRDEEESRYH